MITKLTKNPDNTTFPELHSIDEIKERIAYFRSYFHKIQDLKDEEFQTLKMEIHDFFTLKVGSHTHDVPERLCRISINNNIFKGQDVGLLNNISQLLAPPIPFTNFGRTNLPQQQVLYLATSEAGAYWETKPKKGDVITISHFKLKSGRKMRSFIITKDKTANPEISNDLQEVYYILEDFFVDVFSLEVDRSRPKDYLFSAQISSDLIFYPVAYEENFQAIIYPSVQKKKFDENIAVRNDIIFENYDLIGVETRFILDEYDDKDPSTYKLTHDNIIASIGTETFDFHTGKILYQQPKADELFDLLRTMQMSDSPQVRLSEQNMVMNLSAPTAKNNIAVHAKKIGRNDLVNVVYQDGRRIDNIKYKKVTQDIIAAKCRIVQF